MSEVSRRELFERRRKLGATLRQIRLAQSLSGEELAAQTSLSQPKVSRIETGRVSPRPNDVRVIAEVLKVPAREAKALVTEAERIADINQNFRRLQAAGGVDRIQSEHLAAESLYSHFRSFALAMLPGLLQTPAYARGVIRAAIPSIDSIELNTAVVRRIERQLILEDPARVFVYILAPTSLHFRYGTSPADHLVQLNHIKALAGKPNIEVRALALDSEVVVPVLHDFTICDDTRVVVELMHAEIFVADPEDVDQYVYRFDQLLASALTPDETLLHIDRILAEVSQG